MSEGLLKKLCLTSAAASVAETATFPIDLIKTQLQLQTRGLGPASAATAAAAGTGGKAQSSGGIAITRAIIKQQGLKGLYAGLPPAVVRHIFYTGTRITLYEKLRTVYNSSHAAKPSTAPSSSSSPSAQAGAAASAAAHPSPTLAAKLGMGLTAGAVGQLIAVPADLLKVRMQADARQVLLGHSPQLQYPSMRAAAAAVIRQEGLLGMWRGGLPAVQRAALVNLGELATYDQAKQSILATGLVSEGSPACWALSSMCSGLVATIVSTPADVIKTRLMAQQPQRPSSSSSPPPPPAAVPSAAAAPSAAAEGGGKSRPHGPGAAASRHAAAADAVRWYSSSSGSGGGSPGSAGSSPTGLSGTSSSRLGAVRPAHRGFSAASSGPQYAGALDCLARTVRADGLAGLYKGFFPTWARLGPWQLVFWVSYEQLRHALDMSAF